MLLISQKHYFSEFKKDYPDDKKIERTDRLIETFIIRTGKELTKPYLRSDTILLSVVFEKFMKISNDEIANNPLHGVSLHGYTWHCRLKITDIKRQTLQDRELFLSLENNIRGGVSCVTGVRYIKSDEKELYCIYTDANNLYGWARS